MYNKYLKYIIASEIKFRGNSLIGLENGRYNKAAKSHD